MRNGERQGLLFIIQGGQSLYMALEVGEIVEGRVTGIARFGAFVELPERKTGLVHISEVANEYVSDVNDYLKVNDKVKVKVISVDERGKIALSIKQAAPAGVKKEEQAPREKPSFSHRRGGSSFAGARSARKQDLPASFEDKLSRFLKDSDERLLDLRRNVESKRGGRGSRRSD